MNKAKPIILTLLLMALCAVVSFQIGKRLERASCDPEISALKGYLADAQNLLRDWPQLERYAQANAQLPPPQPTESRVVFIGDSITANWGRDQFGPFFPGKPYINRGIGLQTTAQMLVRFRQDVIALNPRAVVILGGTNDFNGSTIDTAFSNLASMAELAAAHNIRVILASVPPVNDYGKRADGQPIILTRQRPPAKIIELNHRLKEYADAHGFVYLDYTSALVDDKGMLRAEFAYDGLHPNAQGYAVMAPLAEAAITSALK